MLLNQSLTVTANDAVSNSGANEDDKLDHNSCVAQPVLTPGCSTSDLGSSIMSISNLVHQKLAKPLLVPRQRKVKGARPTQASQAIHRNNLAKIQMRLKANYILLQKNHANSKNYDINELIKYHQQKDSFDQQMARLIVSHRKIAAAAIERKRMPIYRNNFQAKVTFRVVESADRWTIVAQIAAMQSRHLCVMLVSNEKRRSPATSLVRLDSDVTMAGIVASEDNLGCDRLDSVLIQGYRSHNRCCNGQEFKCIVSARANIQLSDLLPDSLEVTSQEISNTLHISIQVAKKIYVLA